MPSMFIAPREAKCSSPRRSFDGHELFSHRHTASPSSLVKGLPHTGQSAGMTQRGGRLGASGWAGPTTRGITSPAFSMMTGSPGRMSLRTMSSGLCSVAIEIVDPATTVGSRIAKGVAAPVRPIFTSMRCSIATFCSAGNLTATAHRGNFDVKPRRSRSARSSSLTTTPSVSNSSVARRSRHSSQKATTASMPSHRLPVRLDRTSPGLQRPQQVGMGGHFLSCVRRRGAWHRHHLVQPRRQAPPRHQRGIEVPHGARRGVAGVRVERLAGPLLFLVDAFERVLGQEHLAANLDAAARPTCEGQGQRTDRPDVGSHVLAALAVTAGRAAHEAAVLVGQRDAEPVDLELADIGRGRGAAQSSADPLVERAQLGLVVGVVEAQHRHRVPDRDEAFGRPAAHALRRRIGGDRDPDARPRAPSAAASARRTRRPRSPAARGRNTAPRGGESPAGAPRGVPRSSRPSSRQHEGHEGTREDYEKGARRLESCANLTPLHNQDAYPS